MNNKLIISWDEYNKTVEELAIKVHNSGFKVDLLIGIMRGGAPIIDVLSRIFKIKCGYLGVEPDYCAKKLKDSPWIVQPFEKYEEIRIEDIKKSQD